MGTELQYKISLGVNTALSLLFILLVIMGAINNATLNDAALVIIILITGSYSIFLLFNIQCYAVLKANKMQKLQPDWVQQYGTLLLVLAVIAVVVTAFLFVAATFSLLGDSSETTSRLLWFFIPFLILLLMSVISGIQNIRICRKEKRRNKAIVNSLINDIGSGT